MQFSRHKYSARIFVALVLTLAIIELTSDHSRSSTSARLGEAIATHQVNTCDCEDIPDLESRLAEVNAARAALVNRILNLYAHEKDIGKVVTYSQDLYNDAVERFVQLAIDAAHIAGAHEAKGLYGFTADCSSQLKTDQLTGCLWQSLEVNETVRRKWCEQHKMGGDYPISVYLKKEEDAYRAERDFILGQLDRLLDNCKIGNWTGTVTVASKEEVVINISLPRPGEDPSSAPHGSDITTDTVTAEADFFFLDGQGRAFTTLDVDRTEKIDKSGKTSCHGNVVEKKLADFTAQSSSNMSLHGSTSHPASVSINFDRVKGTYSVSVAAPGAYTDGFQSYQSSETGECAGKPVNTSGSVEKKFYNGPSVRGVGTGRSDALSLDGSYSPQPDTLKVGNMTKTNTYKIEWHLRRARAQ